jgi:hypothetical protein
MHGHLLNGLRQRGRSCLAGPIAVPPMWERLFLAALRELGVIGW